VLQPEGAYGSPLKSYLAVDLTRFDRYLTIPASRGWEKAQGAFFKRSALVIRRVHRR
jgi:hypothetical protein